MTRSLNTKEDRLVESLDRAREPKPRVRCSERDELEQKFHAYVRSKGWAEAKCWAASKAHFHPDKSANSNVRAQAEALFNICVEPSSVRPEADQVVAGGGE